MNCLSLRPLIQHHQRSHPINWSTIFERSAPLDVEIGFGRGDYMMRMVQNHLDRNYVGIEQNWQSIFRTLKQLRKLESSSRVSVFPGILNEDATVALRWLFSEKSIDKIHCLFPCPWPKKGHVKHRLFSNDFLRLVNSRLVDSGDVQIVTDYFPYRAWVLEQVDSEMFACETNTVEAKFGTKYERKWQSEGQQEFYEVCLRKKKHHTVGFVGEVSLKTYRIKGFDPEEFFRQCRKYQESGQFSCPQSGPLTDTKDNHVSVVIKDVMFDSQRNIVMIYVIVVEGEMTQHFRMIIFKRDVDWQLCKADGQSFFPTPGIAKALEVVYKVANGCQ